MSREWWRPLPRFYRGYAAGQVPLALVTFTVPVAVRVTPPEVTLTVNVYAPN